MRSNETYYFGDESPATKIILRPRMWASMRYEQQNRHIIDFPGNYDIDGYHIECVATGDDLHYVMSIDDERVALVQNVQAVEHDAIENIDNRLITDPYIQDYLERQEIEGTITVIWEDPVQWD